MVTAENMERTWRREGESIKLTIFSEEMAKVSQCQGFAMLWCFVLQGHWLSVSSMF